MIKEFLNIMRSKNESISFLLIIFQFENKKDVKV